MTRTRSQTAAGARPRYSWLSLLLVGVVSCNSSDSISSPASEPAPDNKAALASSAVTGIPFGMFAQWFFNTTYTGGLINPELPESLLVRLARAKAGHARIMLTLPGTANKFVNADGTFNFTLWKSRLSRFKGVNFASYITDGTVLGTYLIDQPNCAACWGGKEIPQSTIEAMAKYSKSVYPTLTTVVRADPTWLKAWSGTYVYLDAAWAQYVMRKGSASSYFSSNLSAAKAKGLRLVVGLNLQDGGLNRASLTATQIKDFGSVMLADPYPCAFISWQWEKGQDDAFMTRSDIAAAMTYLGQKAAAHAVSSCK
jgi:hypothetical protein